MKCQIVLQLPEKQAKVLEKVLNQDKKEGRFKTNIKANEGLELNIIAQDAVAMRAALNANLRLIDTCINTQLELI